LRIAVVDASPLINLTHLNLARDLALFFDRVYVPRAVQEEVNRKGRFRYRLNKLYKTGFFVRCLTADRFNVQLLRAELDKGESEALIQAQEKQAPYFIWR
jgi:predicted nucleic acid-binding protein